MWRNDELDYHVNESGDRIVKIDIDSNLLPAISVDTYQTFPGDSAVEMDLEHHAEQYDIDADDLRWNITDHQGVLRALSEAAVETLNDQLCFGGGPEGHGFDIVSFDGVQSVYSPRYYNFQTDSFRSEVTINVSRLVAWLGWETGGAVIKTVERYGYDNFSSRDGFISFVTGAMEDERRLGTLIWLGLHKYLSEALDRDTCFHAVAEAEHGAYTEHLEVALTDSAWECMVDDAVARQLDGLHPEHGKLGIDEWQAWRARAEDEFGSEDLTVAVPDLDSLEGELPRFVDAWVKTAPSDLKHEWQRGAMTGARTCERCGLLPLDDDDNESSCEFWKER